MSFNTATKNFGVGTTNPIGVAEANVTYSVLMTCSDEVNTRTGTFSLTINDVP